MEKKNKIVKVPKKTKTEAVWAGAQSLLGPKPTNIEDLKKRNLVMTASKVLEISPFGVNILGSLPYINELGRKQKAKQYSKDTARYEYQWIQFSKDDKDKSICQCRIFEGQKQKCDWVTGECSPASMKMSTLSGDQNMMAQTRARNRAIQEVYGLRIHEDMLANIYSLIKKGEVNESTANKLIGSASVSSEEMTKEPKPSEQKQIFAPSVPTPGHGAGAIFATDKDKLDLINRAVSLGAPKDGYQSFIERKTGLKVDWKCMTKNQHSRLLFELLNVKK